MKNNSMLMLVLVVMMTALASHTVSAQITITIPGIPKIKKEKPRAPKTETPKTETPKTESAPVSDERPDADTSTGRTEPVAAADACSESTWLDAHLEDIAKRHKEIDEFTPARGWLTSRSTYDHLLFAVSLSARENWLRNSKALDFKDCPNLVAGFDGLAGAAAKKIPQFVPNTKEYAFRNPAEERLMKGKISNLADHKIYYTGVQQSAWLIEKNEFGIPKSRYKHGLAWVRYVPDDHPYCRIYYINIIQDYAGGGTYGASYGYFVRDQLAGCPAGK